MFNTFMRQGDTLEKFRIKAHLRSYLIEPELISETLLRIAVNELKRLPYNKSDPTDTVVRTLINNAFQQGLIQEQELTITGRLLVKCQNYHEPDTRYSNATCLLHRL